MRIQVGKWGNSLGVRIPSLLAKELGLQDGSDVDIQESAGTLIIRPVPTKMIKYSLDDLLLHMTPDSIHSETDWGYAEGQEDW